MPMKTLLEILKLAGGSCLAIALLSGCAFTTDYASLSYVPQTGVSPVPGARAVTVQVKVTDARTIQKDKVGSVINGWGADTAPILTTNDVAGLVKGAIETELANRGFSLGASNVLVAVEISNFYNQFNTQAATGTATVTLGVQVKNGNDETLYAKIAGGEYTAQGLFLASGKNAQVALNLALRDATAKLFREPAFIDSLLKAAKP